MHIAVRSRLAAVPFLALVMSLTACGGSAQQSATNPRPGDAGTTYLVSISRQPGGTIVSTDGRINCGTTATLCGPVAYAWAQSVTLEARPDSGNMFGTWAGDCVGRTKVGTAWQCTLDTSNYGADKFVGAVFGPAGRTQHPNFGDPAVHGPEFLGWVAKKPDTFECTHCHGSSYDGLGIALSCNKCHATPAFPNWRDDCNFCHAAPPAAPHPAVSGDLPGCASCHAETVGPDGKILAGGAHMNGAVQAAGGGHAQGYASPSAHGRDFLASRESCTSCHDLGTEGSCTTCHANAANGWTSWQTNCTFCHGTRVKNGYSFAANPALAAPPDDVEGRLAGTNGSATGAHQAHLGSAMIATAIACADCHAAVADLTHIDGDSRVTFGARAKADGANPAWDPATQSCSSTYCHGSTLPDGPSAAQIWTATEDASCASSCHGSPPPAPHSQSTACSTCHSGYGDRPASGPQAIDPAKHLNGVKDVAALTCSSCHGEAGRTGADPDIAAMPPLGTKGETSTTQPAVGAHAAHLAKGISCAECHARPTSMGHSNGVADLSWGALAGTGGTVPTYNRTTYTCTNYCHGATLAERYAPIPTPKWTGGPAEVACGKCHNVPTRQGTGHPHAIPSHYMANCTTDCHIDSVHIDGKLDTSCDSERSGCHQ